MRERETGRERGRNEEDVKCVGVIGGWGGSGNHISFAVLREENTKAKHYQQTWKQMVDYKISKQLIGNLLLLWW